MAARYVVVDGSNIATEGRSIPSLAQLDEAVRAFMAERPSEQVIVVVDASFSYRIDQSERAEFDQAEEAGEIVSPPAGALGRGDGFLLRIADRTDAVVLSNDSFQEFHGEYPWLFDAGRLIGGKPVPGVGWIFTLRTPVRGPRSRESMRAADKAKRASKRAPVAEGPVAEAIAEATAEAIDPDEGGATGEEPVKSTTSARRARRRRAKPVGSVNDPLPFIEFIAEHPLGTEVEGEVDGFTSHGAFVIVGGARCYVPLVALGDPPPRSAKEVLTRGELRTFVVQALDPPRRGIELALPGLVRVAGVPTEETVEADIGAGRRKRAPSRRPAKPPVEGAEVPAVDAEPVQPAVEVATEEPLAVATAAAQDEAPAKPVRRPAKRARAKAAAEVAEPAGEPEAAPEAAEVAEEQPVPTPAPARRASRSRKKAADVVVPEAPEPALAEAAAEEKPPARRATPRTRRPAADVAAAPAEPEQEVAAGAPSRPARRSAKKAPAAPIQDEPPVAAPARRRRAAAPVEPEAEPPAEAPRRTRKSTAPPVAATPVASEPEPAGEPAATGPRRSPARTAARAAAPRMPVPEAPSEQPSPARRRTRKAAPTEEPAPPAAKKAARKRTAARKSPAAER